MELRSCGPNDYVTTDVTLPVLSLPIEGIIHGLLDLGESLASNCRGDAMGNSGPDAGGSALRS